MTTYIGTPTSRIDGPAKVTGTAKYAGEFSAADLAFGSVVQSTIAKGRIARIDTSDALRVEGVLAVLTHENRPRMANKAAAYKDDVAPENGSPFRPLYDDKIVFSGQPVALVLAEEWEIARFAATLVRVEYEREAFVTDLHAQRDKAFVVKKPEQPRGNAAKAYAAAPVRHEAEYFIPSRTSQSDGIVRFDSHMGWRRQAHGLRQDTGRAERAALSVQRVQHEVGRRARHVAVYGRWIRCRASTAISGRACGTGGTALSSVQSVSC